ncbi:hypothetical protein I5M32_05690 [Pedobacter sp. SD-b]|uniref:Uncharacterized protein n=1 Tax=Pedobacter segetis TaxID=2793069 RepID=A0ABS1BJR4_9SPHI|nr:hypothetical protein [Pedobacter segetis]MBK0382449.1 hypothetical protein [Pedobacter segetis]
MRKFKGYFGRNNNSSKIASQQEEFGRFNTPPTGGCIFFCYLLGGKSKKSLPEKQAEMSFLSLKQNLHRVLVKGKSCLFD